MPSPALKGDEAGVFRIQVIGNSGSGKSRTASQISEKLQIPVICLDKLWYKPGWIEHHVTEFRNLVREKMDECLEGWVVDGVYSRKLEGLVEQQATDIIWLDPPFLLILGRLLKRSILRVVGVDPPCSPGCHESFSHVFFSRESVIWLALTQRERKDRIFSKMLEKDDRVQRFGGWRKDLGDWLQRLTLVSRVERRLG
ncbi:hypothetical protein SISNIDRAFT_459364 [Sistotremastrum niveocremeum HHB9708]|uniref:Adenylate kinase n=1 Tax=Sistotremastrum niveocremeum HHB9708 TaxID=1314777 RepID=A0A164PPZ7_9AGAM|nr:hypothetical protein SISNIDRAFT_459364 [Sistotremastrum niveocremeum HHB9708]